MILMHAEIDVSEYDISDGTLMQVVMMKKIIHTCTVVNVQINIRQTCTHTCINPMKQPDSDCQMC